MALFLTAKRDFIIKGILFILLFAFALGAFMVDVWDPDFWWHLATGKWIVENGRLPDEDPFSFSTLQRDPYTPINRVRFILTQYWLAQVVFYKIYSLFGFAGISVFRALILTCTIGIIVLILRHHKVQAILLLPVAAFSIVIQGYSTGERPQLFSFLFAALLLYLLERHKGSDLGVLSSEKTIHNSELKTPNWRYLYPIPFLMALWSNLHGGYIYGVAVIVIYISSGWLRLLVERLRGKRNFPLRPLVLFTAVGIVAILATCANPNTYHGIIDQFRYQPVVYMINVLEMQPTYKSYGNKPEYFVMLALVTLVMLIHMIRYRRVDIAHLLLFFFNAALSLSALRFIPFFGISGSFLLGIYLKPFFPHRVFERRRWLEGAALFVVSLVTAGFFFFVEGVSVRHLYSTGVSYGLYPYGAAQFLKTLPPKKLFNPYGWGGYLIWTLYPEYKVFIDGRGLNQEIFLQYNEVVRLAGFEKRAVRPKWKAILDGYNIDYLLLAPLMDFASDWSLVSAVAEDKDWRLIYNDDSSLVYIRNREEFRDIIDRYGLPSSLAYATTAWQALERVNIERMKDRRIGLYLVAAETFIRLNEVDNARKTLNRALELDPKNPAVKAFAKAIGMEIDDRP